MKVSDTSIEIKNQPETDSQVNKQIIFIFLTRLLHSRNCFYYYFFLLLFSIFLFFYSIFSYKYDLNKDFIIVSESIIVSSIIIDVIIKSISFGLKEFLKKITNLLDLVIIFFNLICIFLYLEFHTISEKIEEISIVLLVLLRNFVQILRVYTLYKFQLEVKRNLKEKSVFAKFYDEMRIDVIKNKTSSGFSLGKGKEDDCYDSSNANGNSKMFDFIEYDNHDNHDYHDQNVCGNERIDF